MEIKKMKLKNLLIMRLIQEHSRDVDIPFFVSRVVSGENVEVVAADLAKLMDYHFSEITRYPYSKWGNYETLMIHYTAEYPEVLSGLVATCN